MRKYLIALKTGGTMVQPNILYSEHEVIEAPSEKAALHYFNTKNKCQFSVSLGEIRNGFITVPIHFFVKTGVRGEALEYDTCRDLND